MSKEYIHVLSQTDLFNNLPIATIESLLKTFNGSIRHYKKGETIFDAGDLCQSLGIILKGKVELSNFLISGDVSNLVTLSTGHIFGEAVIFAPSNIYPISATSMVNSYILHLKKDEILNLMKEHSSFNEDYLCLLSKKLIFLNDKFKLLSMTTIRGKIAHVLLKLSKEQNSLEINLPFSKEKMASHISTRRPSLSRELSKMKSEGLIDYEKSKITILDVEALNHYLY